jgi:Tfp pilus assembly pilus retraction ATPase PilT
MTTTHDAIDELLDDAIDERLSTHMTKEALQDVFLFGKKLNVSDLSFQEGRPVYAKRNNIVFPISKSSMTSETMKRVVGILYRAQDGDDSAYQQVMSGEDSNITHTFNTGKPGEKKVAIRYRINILRDGDMGLSITCRLNDDQIKPLTDIGHSQDGEIYQNMFPLKGIVLITGSVDSGKTTLIYSCLKHFILNSERSVFIDTYENPIEGDLLKVCIEHGITNKVVRQCPVPAGVKTYSKGIEQSLRKNTDIILTGEVRTRDEMIGVLQGALSTGKLIMATMHTDSVPMTLSRILNLLHSSSDGQLRSLVFDLITSIHMIVSQKLLPTINKKRVAVFEKLIFTKAIKKRLLSVDIDKIPDEITTIMIEQNCTMVGMAKEFLDDNVISQETYDEFKLSFEY